MEHQTPNTLHRLFQLGKETQKQCWCDQRLTYYRWLEKIKREEEKSWLNKQKKQTVAVSSLFIVMTIVSAKLGKSISHLI